MESHLKMEKVNVLIPKKFLCRYPLTTGAIIGGLVLVFVTLICIFALIAQVILMKNCTDCSRYVWKNAYSFSITGVIYSIIMLAMHCLMLWGAKKKMSSILLAWVVITTMWLSQTFFLLIILICMHSADTNIIAWVLSLIFGLIAIGILSYLVLVVFGLWRELKNEKKRKNNIAVTVDK